MNSTHQKNRGARQEPGAWTRQHGHFTEKPIDRLLPRLDGLRKTGADRWIAKCPAHKDRSPSLSLRQCDDGRVLIHCFASCETNNVLAAVGLEFQDLYPPRRIDHHIPRERRPFDAVDVLRCLSREALILIGASAKLLAGETLSQADIDRLQICAYRLLDAEGKAHV